MTLPVVASIVARLEHRQAVEDLLRSMVPLVRAEPGCLRYDLFRATNDPNGFVLIEAYRDEGALEAHRAAGHYRAYRERIAGMIAEPIRVLPLQPLSEPAGTDG